MMRSWLEMFDENGLMGMNPNPRPPKCGATRFRWWMHVPLPYMIPAKACRKAEFAASNREYSLGLHNHFDRETQEKLQPPAMTPLVSLVPKVRPMPQRSDAPEGYKVTREPLQAVAVFHEDSEYSSAGDAFSKATEKINDCFDFLRRYIGRLQRALPFCATWTLYPVSMFDVGIVHHRVDHFCPTTQNWQPVESGVQLSMARQLRTPIYEVKLDEIDAIPPEVDLAHELLAEAQVAIFRGVTRLAVLSCFNAQETLANAVYPVKRVERLERDGMTATDAQEKAESERKKNRTDETFLLHRGMRDACGRSLCDENKALYDQLLLLEQTVRHRVAHRGEIPSVPDAKLCFVVCCEVVRWLCDVGGHPKKEMKAQLSQGSAALAARDPNIPGAGDIALLRHLFGI